MLKSTIFTFLLSLLFLPVVSFSESESLKSSVVKQLSLKARKQVNASQANDKNIAVEDVVPQGISSNLSPSKKWGQRLTPKNSREHSSIFLSTQTPQYMPGNGQISSPRGGSGGETPASAD